VNLDLYPAQRFILKCLYGMELDRKNRDIAINDMTNEHLLYTFTEAEFLKWLHSEGRCNTDVTEGKIFHELVLAVGRRGTKSTLAAVVSNYELYKLVKRGDPSAFYGFPPQTEIVVLNVAPTDDQASIVFSMIQTMAMRCPYLRDRSLNQTLTYFNIQTDADRKAFGKPKASLQSVAGGCSSNALRGRNAITVIMDELAFFIDNGGRFSGGEVYKALTPSIADFRRDGKVLSLSSPYAKFGCFYERCQQSFEEKDITLMFKMWSCMVNPSIPSAILRAARRRDRNSFLCEYGGEFSDRVTAWIDDEDEFRRCISKKTPPTRGCGDIAYYYGIDLGFKNDGTAIVIVHREGKKIILDYATVFFSGSSDVWETENPIYHKCGKYAKLELLRMTDVVDELRELAKWFPPKSGVFDQSNGYGLAELLRAAKLERIEMQHFTEGLNDEVYRLVKYLYAERLVELFDHPVLIPELLTLEAERKSGQDRMKSPANSEAKGKVLVRAPDRKGAHDDLSDAFVRAVWCCHNDTSTRPENVAVGAGWAGGSASASRTPGMPAVKQQTQASFFMMRRQKHGEHARGLYALKRGAATRGRA
jgi:phage terminase large subunit-like protein